MGRSRAGQDDEFDLKPAVLGAAEEEAEQQAQKQKPSNTTRGRWEIDVDSPVVFHKGHKGTVTCVASHPDSIDYGLHTGGKDCCVISWDAATGKKKTIFEGRRKDPNSLGHTGAVTGVAGLWNANLIVSCGEDGKILLWDERCADEPVHRICATVDAFTCLSVLPLSSEEEDAEDGIPRCMVGTAKGDLQCWIINTGEDAEEIEQRKRLWNYYKGHTERVNNIAMTSGVSDRVVSCSDDKTTRYHNLTKDTHLLFDRHAAPVESVAQLVNAVIASGDSNGQLHVWSTGSRKPIASIENLMGTDVHEQKSITSLYSPHGGSHTIFAGGCAGEIRVIQASQLKGRSCDVQVTQKLSINSSLDSSNILVKDHLMDAGLGTVNAFCASLNMEKKKGHLVCAVGRDQRLGRWHVEKGAKDGIAIVNLSKINEDEDSI